jgi:hypothetical protein
VKTDAFVSKYETDVRNGTWKGGFPAKNATESLNQTRRILNPGEQLLPWLKTNRHD